MRGAHSERKPVRREFGLVLGHGHVHMNGSACSFVRASVVRMCTVLVRGLDMGCVLPTGRGVRPELILSLFATFRVCTCRTVFGLDSASRSVS